MQSATTRPNIEKAVYYFTHEIAAALDYMHTRQVIHRDIKGGNVLISHQGMVKICDLGVAKKNQGTGRRRPGVYSTLIGTPHFLSPEIAQLRKKKKASMYTFSADIWSAAATTYEMIALAPPKVCVV